MLIKRHLSFRILKLSKKFPIVSIVGARQTGKTTLVKNLFKSYQYVSLEDLDIRAFAQSDPRSFLEQYHHHVILDEIQQVPSLFPYLQTHVDQTNQPGQFIITGSNNFLLHQKISQSLSGRVALINLHPLTMSELYDSKIEFSRFEDYLYRGFYPRSYQSSLSPGDWYPNYVQTYLERDVRDLLAINNLVSFQTFLKLCAGRIGQILNLSSLGNDSGISHNTAKAWLSVLEASFIVYRLPSFYKNYNKRLIKSPKLYFYDVGLALYLLGINSKQTLFSHPLKGALFENLIISELVKHINNFSLRSDLYFWRDKIGHEIDLLVNNGTNNLAIEIKSGKTVSQSYFSGLDYWFNLVDNKSQLARVIFGGSDTQNYQSSPVLSWNIFKKRSRINKYFSLP